MGVVRDVTIDQLTQAVQGISSAGMTDTTGQDIKDSIDALDMTAGTLGKDSSLQDIKDSIDALANTISPAAANVTFDNTSSGLSASNVQAAIDEVDASLDELNATSTSISRYSGVSSSVPLPAISRRGKIVIIHFAHQLPAGTYTNIWNVTPAPASQQHALVAIGNSWTIMAVTAAGVVKFNNSVTINSDQYVIGQIIYNTN